MGPAGPHASTHIYDFMVHKVDFEGRIYMKHMVCRRPPLNPIHWRSTKRLALNCLVAVVKLPDKDAPIYPSYPIIWCEIAVHDQARDEFRRRENGELVVSDLRDGQDKLELQRGDHVAVIDCMVFIPEHIPVLKALDDMQLTSLPFNEGKEI